jgi:DNA helicase-2/ATP-dependent DNA helicase PcrA
MNLSEVLNPAQAEAAAHVDGPILVLAGAGSGKTRVLTYRIAHMIEQIGIDPHHILAVTFTNKAAKEMKKRIEELLGPGRSPEWVGTFHSLSSRILRREADNLGFRRDFVIYDSDDQLALIKKMMKELNINEKQFAPEAIRSNISGAKDQLMAAEEYAERGNNFFEQRVARVYTAYQKALENSNAMDFDDLIMKLAVGYAEVPSMLERFQERFQYIMVDEYQDTNHAQYEWVNRLAKKKRNLCVVGDDDQSIYAWRGADIGNILDFEKDYPETRIVRLEQNYRSTKLILDASNAVIKINKGRKGKELWTENPPGDKIGLAETTDERDEASWIARKIRDTQAEAGRPLRDFTILYRTNAQSRALEDKLRRANMPYVIVGGLRFYERKEVKDVLAYLKVIANPRDSISFRRMINTPPRGLGNVSVERIERFALSEGLDLLTATNRSDEAGLMPAAARSAKTIGQLLTALNAQLEDLSGGEIARRVIEGTGYLRDLEIEAAKNVEAETRAQNVKELMAAIEEATERNPEEQKGPGLQAFLEEVALVADIDKWDGTVDRITMMTLHNAKGLEFPIVFIAGMEDGLFPIARAMENPTDLEEERRLFYVGITRAEDCLYLTHANRRSRFGNTLPALRSRFISEVPEEFIEQEIAVRRPITSWSGKGSPPEQTFASPFDNMPASPETVQTSSGKIRIAQGQRVKHPIWGEGRILQVNGSGDNMQASIQFSSATKKVMLKYAALEMI